ncbi:hypothetical protein ACFX2I_023987 [Malus domestica]
MRGGGRRKKQHFGRIHVLSCGKASFNGEHSWIGSPGFSSVVYCNDPECLEATLHSYQGNYVWPRSITFRSTWRRPRPGSIVVDSDPVYSPAAPLSATCCLRRFYLAVDRHQFKMETLMDLLGVAGRRPGLPMVVCCSSRDELDAISSAVANVPYISLAFLDYASPFDGDGHGT